MQTDANGLYYMRARYYSPELGRFINEYPIRDGLNWYAYAGGNPITFIDPTGLWGVEVHFIYTQKCARDAGFSRRQARILAESNIGVDIVWQSAAWQPNKDKSWHLNTFETGDSRIDHAERMLKNAISIWNQADIDYNNAIARLSSSDRRARQEGIELAKEQHLIQRDLAITTLGRGLHALQDISAHANIDKHKPGSGHDNVRYDWIDATKTGVKDSGKRYGERYYEAQIATIGYLAKFVAGIEGSLR